MKYYYIFKIFFGAMVLLNIPTTNLVWILGWYFLLTGIGLYYLETKDE